MKTLKQHLQETGIFNPYRCTKTSHAWKKITLEAVKEWLQEQLDTPTAKKWEVDEIDLYVIKTNLILELEK